MKKLIVLIAALGVGCVIADDQRIQSTSLTVIDRLETIELINVTQERAPLDNIEPLDAALLVILQEVEAIESEQNADPVAAEE